MSPHEEKTFVERKSVYVEYCLGQAFDGGVDAHTWPDMAIERMASTLDRITAGRENSPTRVRTNLTSLALATVDCRIYKS